MVARRGGRLEEAETARQDEGRAGRHDEAGADCQREDSNGKERLRHLLDHAVTDEQQPERAGREHDADLD